MKRVTAYIKPHKLSDVTRALHRIDGLTGMSAADVRGFGRGRAKDVPHTITEDLVDYVPHVRLEAVCRDEIVEEVVETIRREAHTGLRGDGKIYVAPVEDAIRISTGERGEAAV
jgi:nitrogen regulatory protein PII